MRSSLFFNLNNSHLYRRRVWIVWCIPICSLCARTRLHCALSVDNVILHTNKIRAMDRDIFLYIQITLLLLFSLYLPLSLSPKPQTRAMDRDICLYIQITLLLLFSLYLPLSPPKPHSIHPSAIPEAQLFKLSSSHTCLSDSCLFHMAEFFKLSSLERRSIPGDQYFIF